MATSEQYNLQYLKKSRLKSGDIFVMHVGDTYLFGRVVSTHLSFEDSPFGGSNLIYIYNVRSASKTADYSRLTPNNLLMPPLYISNVLWSQGYAIRAAHADITSDDLLQQHCFYSSTHNIYLDEKGNERAHKTEPCGEWVYVVSLRYLDNKISDALGILRAPLTEDDIYYMSGKGAKISLKKPTSELKKYVNYQWIIDNHPEIIER